MRTQLWIQNTLDGQRGALFPWVPVFFAAGIGWYFSLTWEPSEAHWQAIVAAMAVLLAIGWWRGEGRRLGITALLLVLAGFSVAGLRAHNVAATVLDYRYYGPVEGRIVAIDRSVSDAVRLTLDRVRLHRVPPHRTPERVRIALHGVQGYLVPEPGLTVIATAHLSPPSGPVEPGGFDFRRQAWFQGLGAVGYTRVPVLAFAPHEGQEFSLAVYRFRMRVSAAVQQALPPPVGGFAAAITTGDRSGIDQEVLQALRRSNLAHLLAISGLHMGLLTGFVFASLRIGLAGVPGLALRRPIRKYAACGGLAAGAVYLLLSGGNVATERAFIMVAVMFVAVIVGRRAVTLRSVAVAAMIVLALRPEALLGPGFQMSFAATTALVAVYGALNARDWSPTRWPLWVRVAGGVTLTSFVAGMATAPIAAAHFNLVPHYGLIANVVSVPLMGAIVIPAAVLAALVAPFGLAPYALWLMKWPILWILNVAQTVSEWPGAVSPVVTPGNAVLPLLGVSGLLIVIVKGQGRWVGLPVLAAAGVLWFAADRPDVLVSESGGIVGMMTDEGRSLSKPRGDGFSAKSWLENDGDVADQADSHARGGFAEVGRSRVFLIGGEKIVHATGKKAAALALSRCQEAWIVVVNVSADNRTGCLIFDSKLLAETGSLAIKDTENGPRILTARDVTGERLWSQ